MLVDDFDSGRVVGCVVVFFFQAEDGIGDLVRSRGLGDVYKRQRRGVVHQLPGEQRRTDARHAGAAGCHAGNRRAPCQYGLSRLLSRWRAVRAVSYTHLRAHETVLDLVCRLLLEKKKN